MLSSQVLSILHVVFNSGLLINWLKVWDDGALYTYPLAYTTFCNPVIGSLAAYTSTATPGCYDVTLTGFRYKQINAAGNHWDEISAVIVIGS